MSRSAPVATFWFLYMAGMGVIFPYQSLYLYENAALAGTQLGLVLAIRPLMGILAQPFWGQVADRTGSRTRVLAFITLATALAYSLFPLAQGFLPILVAMAFTSLFSTSVMPMTTSVSLAVLGDESARYFGRMRAWGTVGFLCLVLSFPMLLNAIQRRAGLEARPDGPSEPGLQLIFYFAAFASVVAAVSTLRFPRGGALSVPAVRGDLRRLLRHGPYVRVLGFVFVAFLLLQGPILLFAPFIRAKGGSIETVAAMWVPMLLVEIPLVFWIGSVIGRIGVRGVLAIATCADGLRWVLSASVDDLRVIFALQFLHGVVVAGLHVSAQLYVEAVVPERLRSTGQGLLAMAGASLGGILSLAGSGWLFEHVGPEAPYWVGGCGAILLGASVWWILPPPTRQG